VEGRVEFNHGGGFARPIHPIQLIQQKNKTTVRFSVVGVSLLYRGGETKVIFGLKETSRMKREYGGQGLE
jgi:hypothetical protein